jgi:hypothetical protein
MNINRNNYEDFLLLYIDGELNSQEEQAVNNFLQANTDLQQELNMLLDAKLMADETLIFDKSSLYKNENTAINTSNYEEKFLLYVDNELNDNTKQEVETFVLQNPTLQANFTALKNTVLPTEQIVCPDKKSLYKKEEKPVVFMWVKRLSVAAAILLFAVMAWVFTNKQNQSTATSTVSVNNNNGSKKNVVTTVTSSTPQPLKIESSTATNQPQKMPILQPNNTIETKQFVKNINPKNTIAQTVIVVAPQQAIANNTSNPIGSQKNEIASVINTKIETNNPMNAVVKSTDLASTSIQTVHKTQPINNTIRTTVYKPLEEDEDDIASNNTVYIGNMQLNKNKVDGLLKKAKELFTKSKKTSNQDSYIATANTL